MAMVNKIKKGNVEKEIHDSRLPELTGEEAFCVPFVNDDGTAFQIGSIPTACLDNGSVTTEKIANNAITKAKIDSTSAESIADHVIHATAVYENNELVTSVEEDATTVMEWILDFDKTCAAMLTYDGVKYFLPCLYRADTSPDLEAIFGSASVFFSSAGHGELTNLSLYVDVWAEDGDEPEIGEVRLKTSRQLLLAEDGAVEGRNIEDGAITGRKIANNTITRSKLADDALKWSNRPSGAGSANADQSKEAYLDDKTAIITGGEISAIDLYEAAPAGSTTYKIARHQYGSGSGIIDLALGASPTTDRQALGDFYMSNLVVNGDFIVVNEITDDYIEIELSESLNPDSQIWRFNSERFPFEVHNFNKVNSLHIGTGITNDCILDGLVMGYAIDAGEHSSNARGIGSIIAGRFIQNCGNPRIINGEGIINGEYKGSVLIGENLHCFSAYATLIGLGHTSSRVPYITAFGKYSNITNDSQFVIGNGEDDSHRSNLFEIKTTGEVIVGADPTVNMGVATKHYVDNRHIYRHSIICEDADGQYRFAFDCFSDSAEVVTSITNIPFSSDTQIMASGLFKYNNELYTIYKIEIDTNHNTIYMSGGTLTAYTTQSTDSRCVLYDNVSQVI